MWTLYSTFDRFAWRDLPLFLPRSSMPVTAVKYSGLSSGLMKNQHEWSDDFSTTPTAEPPTSLDKVDSIELPAPGPVRLSPWEHHRTAIYVCAFAVVVQAGILAAGLYLAVRP